MRIRDARPVRTEPSPRGFNTIARFTFEPVDGVVICTLVRAPDGRVLIYGPPSKTSSQIMNLAPEVRRAAVSMTQDLLGIKTDDRNAA
jgi:hypothetical protein